MTHRSMIEVDHIIRKDGPYSPRWGWHDDHQQHDGKPEYLPALQQVREEFSALLDAIAKAGLLGGRCLQLGIGECRASHTVWNFLFQLRTVTIDWREILYSNALDAMRPFTGADTHSVRALRYAQDHGPYDFLFIDAGHTLDDVRADHLDYGPLVRPGGIIAFHDARERRGYPEVAVWRYLEMLGQPVNFAGEEVGVAWIVQS